MVNIKINNRPLKVEEGTTILEACRQNGIKVPTLCFLKDCNQVGACRVCVVEVKGARSLAAACVYPVSENMEVLTHSTRAIEARKATVELILSNHSKNCLSCVRNQTCELQDLAQELNVRDVKFKGDLTPITIDNFSNGIVRDTSKCVVCGRCVSTCQKVQGLGVLGFENRGFKTIVAPVMNVSLSQVNCMQCGQCVIACPTGALHEKESIDEVIQALNNPRKHVVVQTAPAIRASLGEEFNLPIGTRVTGKMVCALKKIGFDRVYDTNYSADLTIMEEGTEFIDRFTNQGVLPMITSCSPGWVRFIEFEYPELLDHLSTCKSPHMMFGAILKSYYAKTKGINPEDMYVVSVMPCTAKKEEIERDEMIKNNIKDVDAVITTRELGKLIKMYGVDFNDLEEDEFDQDMFGEYTGAGVIFGVTGGVMEAALRTVKEVLENKSFDEVNYEVIRGQIGVKEACLSIAGHDVWIAVASSMNMARPLLEEIKNKTSKYAFIEIMGCPGGCINGGGQSIVSSKIKNDTKIDYRALRAKTLYDEDESLVIRKSHENPQIIALYDHFLGEPNSHLAHDLLHTTYHPRKRFKIEE
ncbi:MAG: NADH-dependent [FeFe] hydrogenase, group A6 [Erysipelotrichaceae bacterium]